MLSGGWESRSIFGSRNNHRSAASLTLCRIPARDILELWITSRLYGSPPNCWWRCSTTRRGPQAWKRASGGLEIRAGLAANRRSGTSVESGVERLVEIDQRLRQLITSNRRTADTRHVVTRVQTKIANLFEMRYSRFVVVCIMRGAWHGADRSKSKDRLNSSAPPFIPAVYGVRRVWSAVDRSARR